MVNVASGFSLRAYTHGHNIVSIMFMCMVKIKVPVDVCASYTWSYYYYYQVYKAKNSSKALFMIDKFVYASWYASHNWSATLFSSISSFWNMCMRLIAMAKRMLVDMVINCVYRRSGMEWQCQSVSYLSPFFSSCQVPIT